MCVNKFSKNMEYRIIPFILYQFMSAWFETVCARELCPSSLHAGIADESSRADWIHAISGNKSGSPRQKYTK